MITAKFGGTAVTPNNLQFIKSIITPQHNAVVVSAVGREFPNDDKTTDLLIDYYNTGSDEAWNKISAKYKKLVERNSIDVDIDKLLYSAKSRARAFDLDYCKSLGEELSAKVVAKFLDADYVEAQDAIVFGKSKLNTKQTLINLKSVFEGGNLSVIGGFYGGWSSGRKTFSRGGSDVTGAYVAAATNAALYENWTDVYGVCAANPTVVSNVKTISTMSYDEMRALSLGGAEVLHPDAVLPVQKLSIPIRIGNFFNPQGDSTIVCNCASNNGLLSITEKKVCGKTVVTILHNYRLCHVLKVLAEFLRQNQEICTHFESSFVFDKIKTYGLAVSTGKVELTLSQSAVCALYKCFIACAQTC